MTSLAIRDPFADRLLTPQNSALILIDYQPTQVAAVRSIDLDLLTRNVASTLKLARLFDLPLVHSTVNVSSGRQALTISPLAELLDGHPAIDRTTINAWEDQEFLAAVRETGRRKLIMCALWTEMCLAFPALDALREGYEGVPGRRRHRRHVGGSSSGGAGACGSGRRPTDYLGLAGGRASARLGPIRHSPGPRRRCHQRAPRKQ